MILMGISLKWHIIRCERDDFDIISFEGSKTIRLEYLGRLFFLNPKSFSSLYGKKRLVVIMCHSCDIAFQNYRLFLFLLL